MKIVIGKLGQETNTFSIEKGTFEYWSRAGWCTGNEILNVFRGKTDYLSGMIKVADEHEVELIPTVSMLDAGPLITREALDYALGEMLKIISKHRDEINGVCLALHGAGCAEGIDDIEAYILANVRKIIGNDIPIMITLDLHANMSQAMLDETQGIFGIKQYPHTDYEQAGEKAMQCLIDYLQKGRILYESLIKLPILLPCSAGNTVNGLMAPFEKKVSEFKREHKLVDATVFHGFPYADRPLTGMSVLTVSEESQDDADKTAQYLANYIWENREQLRYTIINAHEAVNAAAEFLENSDDDGYIVINETSDNPGGGTACDATGLLSELMKRQEYKSILGYIHDPEIAILAHRLGVGSTISGFLGAKKDNLHGKPIYLDNAYVAALSDGEAVYNSPIVAGQKINYGKSARIVIGNCEVVVVEKNAQQTYDDATFTMVGADINDYQIVGVKSSNHFRAWFAPRAKAIITANEAGIQTDDLSLLPYEHINRPMFPLDSEVTFHV